MVSTVLFLARVRNIFNRFLGIGLFYSQQHHGVEFHNYD